MSDYTRLFRMSRFSKLVSFLDAKKAQIRIILGFYFRLFRLFRLSFFLVAHGLHTKCFKVVFEII